MQCPKCGSENTDNVKFCQHCGTQIRNVSEPIFNKRPQLSKKAWYKKWWIWLIIGLGTIFISFCSLFALYIGSVVINDSYGKQVPESINEHQIQYDLDSVLTYRGIEIYCDSTWDYDSKSIKDTYSFSFNEPFTSIYIFAAPEIVGKDATMKQLLETWSNIKEDEELIDTQKVTTPKISGYRIKKQKKMFQSEIYDEYTDTFIFLANNTYYVIYLSGDINYQKDYTDLMTELIYSISIVKEKTN